MLLLEAVAPIGEGCVDGLSDVFNIIRNVMTIIMIIVPILLILWGTFDLLKAVVAQKDEDMKKAWKTLLQRAIYGILIFLLSTIVMFAIRTVGGQTSAENCIQKTTT